MPDLFPSVRAYFDDLAAAPFSLRSDHRLPCEKLSAWIKKNRAQGKDSTIVVVCTGNSRRSVFGSVLGNVAADYLELDCIRFQSAGTEPCAVNPRTIRALEEVGVNFSQTGALADPGPGAEPNPIYSVRWGENSTPTIEYSKRVDDLPDSSGPVAAILVCDHANETCPTTPSATIRLPLTFEDPKEADDTPNEAGTYRQRRDEIAQTLLHILRDAAV